MLAQGIVRHMSSVLRPEMTIALGLSRTIGEAARLAALAPQTRCRGQLRLLCRCGPRGRQGPRQPFQRTGHSGQRIRGLGRACPRSDHCSQRRRCPKAHAGPGHRDYPGAGGKGRHPLCGRRRPQRPDRLCRSGLSRTRRVGGAGGGGHGGRHLCPVLRPQRPGLSTTS